MDAGPYEGGTHGPLAQIGTGLVRWTGELDVLFHSGQANDPNGNSFSYRVCMAGTEVTGTLRGYVSGWAEASG